VDAFIQKKLAKAVANSEFADHRRRLRRQQPEVRDDRRGAHQRRAARAPELTRADVLRYLQQQGQ
jgi:hypothetical protein